jgi:hypothetical protein
MPPILIFILKVKNKLTKIVKEGIIKVYDKI